MNPEQSSSMAAAHHDDAESFFFPQDGKAAAKQSQDHTPASGVKAIDDLEFDPEAGTEVDIDAVRDASRVRAKMFEDNQAKRLDDVMPPVVEPRPIDQSREPVIEVADEDLEVVENLQEQIRTTSANNEVAQSNKLNLRPKSSPPAFSPEVRRNIEEQLKKKAAAEAKVVPPSLPPVYKGKFDLKS